MPKASPIQTSFNAGEFTPLMHGRTDFPKYRHGLERCRNYVPVVQGPLLRRPGTRFVAETKDNEKVRLVPFIFSRGQSYVLEWGPRYVRFFAGHGQVVSGGNPYETSLTFFIPDSAVARDELREISFAQSFDTLYVAHRGFNPFKLVRFGHTAWSGISLRIYTGSSDPDNWRPYFDENVDVDLTITSNAMASSGTLTASEPLFTSEHVGTFFRLRELIPANHDPWTPEEEGITAGDTRHFGGNVYEAQDSGTAGNRAPVHTRGTESDGSLEWLYWHSGSGEAYITSVLPGGTQAIVTITKLIPRSVMTEGTYRWAESAWGTTRRWPACVTFFEDRLCYASSSGQPTTVWMSRSGDYENFARTTLQGEVTDDSGITFTLDAGGADGIQWMAALEKGLAIGTSAEEWLVRPSSSGEALTPTNLNAKPSTGHGSARIQPLRVGNQLLFVQSAERKLRELVYNYDVDGFTAPDLTVLAEHVTAGGIREIAFQKEPHTIMWAVRGDGKLLGMSYSRDQDSVAWHVHDVGGFVESIAVIPAPDGAREELWMVVRREVNGNTKRYVEYMEKFWEDVDEPEDAFFVDCGLTYDGSPATTISGLDHLEGETVAILADGAAHPERVVSGGQVTLDYAASKVHVGLPMVSEAQTLRIDAGAADGTAQGKTKRIHRVTMRVHRTLGLKVGRDFDHLNEVTFRRTTDAMDGPPPLFSGDVEVPWEGTYDTEGYVCWRQDQPLPGTILAVMPQLVTQDR